MNFEKIKIAVTSITTAAVITLGAFVIYSVDAMQIQLNSSNNKPAMNKPVNQENNPTNNNTSEMEKRINGLESTVDKLKTQLDAKNSGVKPQPSWWRPVNHLGNTITCLNLRIGSKEVTKELERQENNNPPGMSTSHSVPDFHTTTIS